MVLATLIDCQITMSQATERMRSPVPIETQEKDPPLLQRILI